MQTIDELFAYCYVENGKESLASFKNTKDEWIPLIAASTKRLEVIKPIAEELAAESSIPLRLIKFGRLDVVDVVEPGKLAN